jgi:hypothetical protein
MNVPVDVSTYAYISVLVIFRREPTLTIDDG